MWWFQIEGCEGCVVLVRSRVGMWWDFCRGGWGCFSVGKNRILILLQNLAPPQGHLYMPTQASFIRYLTVLFVWVIHKLNEVNVCLFELNMIFKTID